MANPGNDAPEDELEQAIQQFAEVTATDEAFAHYMLQENDYDLNRALTCFFNSQAPEALANAPPAGNPPGAAGGEATNAPANGPQQQQPIVVDDDDVVVEDDVAAPVVDDYDFDFVDETQASEDSNTQVEDEAIEGDNEDSEEGNSSTNNNKVKYPEEAAGEDETKSSGDVGADGNAEVDGRTMATSEKVVDDSTSVDEGQQQRGADENVCVDDSQQMAPMHGNEDNNVGQKEEEEEPPEKRARRINVVDPLVVQQQPKQPQQQKQQFPPELTFLTWNIDGLDDRNRAKRFTAVLYVIAKNNPEVIFLQEMITPLMPHLKSLMEPMYHIVVQQPNIGYFCVTLVSKNITITRKQVIAYDNTSMGRGLIVVEAEWQNLKLKLLNTHLESTKDFSVARTAQFTKCIEQTIFLTAVNPAETVAIFAGDLNIRDSEVGDLPISLRDAWMAAGSDKENKFTWDMKKNDNYEGRFGKATPTARYDRVFFSGPAVRRVDFRLEGNNRIRGPNCFASDHFAVVCRFALNNDGNTGVTGTPKLPPLEEVLERVPDSTKAEGTSANQSHANDVNVSSTSTPNAFANSKTDGNK